MRELLHARPWLGPLLFVLAFVLLPLIPGGYVLYIFSLVLNYGANHSVTLFWVVKELLFGQFAGCTSGDNSC